MADDDGDGRATPYEDALSALALEDDDDEEEEGQDGPASLASVVADDDARAAYAPPAAPLPAAVSADAAAPAEADPEGDEEEGEGEQHASPLPSRLLDPSKPKHVLVLSNAGKPIFSRHRDEQRLAPLMGMVQAIMSLTAAEDEEGGGGGGAAGGRGGDCVRSIATAGGRKLVFLARGELYLLAVARTGEPEPYLKLQLEYVYQQVRRTRLKNIPYDRRPVISFLSIRSHHPSTPPWYAQIVLLLTARRIARCFAANPL